MRSCGRRKDLPFLSPSWDASLSLPPSFFVALSVYLFFFPLSASCPSLTLFLFLFLLSHPPLPTPRMRPKAGRTLFCCTCRRTWVGARSLYTAALHLISSRPFHSERDRERGRAGGREEYKGGLTEAGPLRGGREQREKGTEEKLEGRHASTGISSVAGSGGGGASQIGQDLVFPNGAFMFFTPSANSTNEEESWIKPPADFYAREVVLLCFFSCAAKRLSGYRLLFFPPALQCRSWHLVACCWVMSLSYGALIFSRALLWANPDSHTQAARLPQANISDIQYMCEWLTFVTSLWCIHYTHAKRPETSESSFFFMIAVI